VQIFKTEVCDGIIAPGFEPEALEILKNKKKVMDNSDKNKVIPSCFVVVDLNNECT
jgi:AICAR transformylase/IMP cyclohydrolase PurH